MSTETRENVSPALSPPVVPVAPVVPLASPPVVSSSSQRTVFTTNLTVWRVMAYTAAVLFVLFIASVLQRVADVIVLGLIGVLLATAIDPVARRLQTLGLKRMPSVLLVYLLIVAAIGLFVGFVLPPIVAQAAEFGTSLPTLLNNFVAEYENSDNIWFKQAATQIKQLYKSLTEASGGALSSFDLIRTTLVGALSGVFGSLVSVVTTVLISFYWLSERNFIRRSLLSFVSEDNRDRVGSIWDHIENKLGAWFRAQLILCTIIGVACAIFYGSVGLRYWPLLAFIAAVTEIIPIIGPWLGGIPAVLIALLPEPGATGSGFPVKAVVVAVFIVVLQQIEGNVLVPRIQGDAIGLSPLTVILAVLAGTSLAGIVGGLLAVPASAIIQVLIQDLVVARYTPDTQDLQPALDRGSRRTMRGDPPVSPDAHPTRGVLRQVREAVRPPHGKGDSGAGDD